MLGAPYPKLFLEQTAHLYVVNSSRVDGNVYDVTEGGTSTLMSDVLNWVWVAIIL